MYLPRRLSESCVEDTLALVDAMIDTPVDGMSGRAKLSPGIGQPRMLVVGSSTDMRFHLDRLLRKELYEVLSIADGEAVLTAIRRQKPDLVFTEVILPQLDGLDLLSALGRQAMPIIALSTSVTGEARAACLRAGADDYLVMPCSASDLLARVEGYLALSRLRATAVVAVVSRLHGVSCSLTAISDLATLLQEVLSPTIELLDADIAAQQWLDAELLQYLRNVIINSNSTSARTLNAGIRVVTEDVNLDPDYGPHWHIAASAGFRAVQSMPFIERSSGCARAIDPAGDGLHNVECRVNGAGNGVERWVSARRDFVRQRPAGSAPRRGA
jgi:CheY-like chemotaxis protein